MIMIIVAAPTCTNRTLVRRSLSDLRVRVDGYGDLNGTPLGRLHLLIVHLRVG